MAPHLVWSLLLLDCFKRVSGALDQPRTKTSPLAPKRDCQGLPAAKVDLKLYFNLSFIT